MRLSFFSHRDAEPRVLALVIALVTQGGFLSIAPPEPRPILLCGRASNQGLAQVVPLSSCPCLQLPTWLCCRHLKPSRFKNKLMSFPHTSHLPVLLSPEKYPPVT